MSSTALRPTPDRANRPADATEATDAPGTPRPRVPALAQALLAYVGVRALGLAVLAPWAHRQHHGVWPILATQWDAEYYLGIADHGYAHALGGMDGGNNLVFFPLYPVLVKAVAAVTPGTRATTGLCLAVAASLLAAWGIYAVGTRLQGPRAGVLLTVLWAALPVGLVQWMGYTESLFTACAAWTLYALLTDRPLTAAWLATLAGLTRPTGIAVAAAVTLTCLLSWRRPRALLAAFLAPLGWFAYVGWVGLRLHRWDGYFAVQRTWRNEVDGGLDTLRQFRSLLLYDPTPELFLLLVTATLLASTALFALSLRDRQPAALLVFTAVTLLIVLTSGGVYFPRARYLLPAFPLLLPIAVRLTKAPTRYRHVILTTAVLGSAYWGAYMTLVWTGPP
ncbi:hypothetical protein ACFUIY_18875 [Streptomyces griseorubiginosus]|uniref:hypothetical protein n=1 Tax=Streptomyces griseorubiginosus TaxID=67304 RepID=UPI003624E6A3